MDLENMKRKYAYTLALLHVQAHPGQAGRNRKTPAL